MSIFFKFSVHSQTAANDTHIERRNLLGPARDVNRGDQGRRMEKRGTSGERKEQSVGYSRPGALFDEEGRRMIASREGAGRRVTLDAASSKPDATTLQKVLPEMISSQAGGNCEGDLEARVFSLRGESVGGGWEMRTGAYATNMIKYSENCLSLNVEAKELD